MTVGESDHESTLVVPPEPADDESVPGFGPILGLLAVALGVRMHRPEFSE